MKFLARIIMTLNFVLIGTSLSYAQTPPPFAPAPSSSAASNSGPPPPPTVSATRKTIGKAEVYYYEKFNETRATVSFNVIGQHDSFLKTDVLSMQTAFEVTGRKLIKPEFVYLSLFSHSYGLTYKYKDNPKLTIFLDDVVFASSDLQPSFTSNDRRGGFTEDYVSPKLPYDKFLQILGAKKIKMKFGNTEFEIKGENLKALRDLNKVVEQ